MKRSIGTRARSLLASALLAFSALAAAQAPTPPTFYPFYVIGPVGETTGTYLFLANPNGFSLTGVSVQVPMPSGYVVNSAITPTYCTITSDASTPGGISMVIDMPTNTNCFFNFTLMPGVPGLFDVTGTVTGATFPPQTSPGKFSSYLRGAIGASFSPNPVAPGSPSTLSIMINNADPNHGLTVDGGEGGNASIPIGADWSSAVVIGANPPGCATDDIYPTYGLPFIQDYGYGNGPELFFNAYLPPGTDCVITVEVMSTIVGSFTVPTVPWNVSTYYDAPYPWSSDYDSGSVTPSTLVVRVATGPIGSFSPARLDFGTIPARGSAGPLEATLTNTGTGPLSILGIEVLGGANFGVSNNCIASLGPGVSCAFLASFSAATPGPYFGEVRVSSDAAGSPHTLALSGSVTAVPIGALSAAPSALSFTERVIGTTSAPQAVTITNTGDAPAVISTIGTTGEFSVQGSCPTLAPGATCTVQVTFRPTGTGTRTGQLQVASNAANPVLSVGLTGVGAPIPTPSVSLSPTTLDFGERVVGASTTLTATLTNSGTADLVLGAFTVVGDFGLTNGCPATLGAKQSCRLDVEFIATVPGRRTGSVQFTSNAAGSPHTLNLAGRGCRLAVTGRSFSLDCGR